jgi:predicted enzyme related to lactoylglutathione lyase
MQAGALFWFLCLAVPGCTKLATSILLLNWPTNIDTPAWRQHWSAGDRVALPKFAVPGVCWHGYFIDPDGNTFGVFQPDSTAK